MDKLLVTATYDKDTKNCYRFTIDENDKGVAGLVYVQKTSFEGKPPKSIRIKVFEPKTNTDEKDSSKKKAKGKK